MAWEAGRSGDAGLDGVIGEIAARGGGRAGGGRLPQHALRPPRARPPLHRPRVGPRALLLRPPHPGGRGAAAHARRGPADGRRGARGRPRLRRVRARRQPRGVRAPGDRDGARRALPRDRRAALPRPGEQLRRAARPAGARRQRARPRVLPGRDAAARGARVPGPRRARAVPGERRGRRRDRDRRRRAPGDDRAAVGAHDRAAHVPDRGHGLAARGRGVRRGLRAAARSRLLGDLRRRRVGAARVATAAGHRRRALRGPRGADALQRRGDITSAGRQRVLLREPAPPAGAGRGARPRRGEPARGLQPAGAVVPRLVLPDQRRAHAGEPRRLRGDDRRRRDPAPPARVVQRARARRGAQRADRTTRGAAT